MALLVSSGFAIMVILVLFQKASLQIDSRPPGASVWVDGSYVGVAPVALKNLAKGRRLVVVKKHGHATWRRTVSPRGSQHQVVAELKPIERNSLAVMTAPPGALVMVDGDARGRTPVAIEGIAPGAHRLRLLKQGFVPCELTVSVGEGDLVTVDRKLDSNIEAYFRRQVEGEPANLHHIVELGKHYVLTHEFDKAAATFLGAASHLNGYGESDSAEGRLYQELDKIHEAQFEYGDYQAVQQGQAMVRHVLEGYIAGKGRNAYVHYYLGRAYRREGQYQKATEQLRQAQRRAEGSTLLRRIDREFKQLYR